MKKSLVLAGLCAAAFPVFSSMASAGPIESACLRSGRDAASRALCGCIQEVADMTLKGNDQRRAAKFFRNPDQAHEVWVSQRPADDEFWDRYKNFGAMAEAYCAQ
ncbi:hypothetical protein [Pseudogemmobacter blasticus]|uniref:Arginine transporter n=1 Tax=Fuscovulum blasticum DSM 2131 TaxID=1188250 RepID=A0A2T4J4B0_FUSBL|nr:hypothetical protein [Fuscovulum blasticum]AWD21271.1 hypothetical protein B6K69_05970 [Fuscovulum blasticum]PTE12693.1 hypothetical protein C5F44_17120 [Fuscovulum blasticum DSM 2131]